MDYDEILRVALGVARRAAQLIQKEFPGTALQHVEHKGAVDPVTETDRASERLIVDGLQAAFPDFRILAEERDGKNWRSWSEAGAPLWLIDPLDGTVNFAHGFPFVGLSLGLLVDARPVLGIVADPLRDEWFTATERGGAQLNGQPIRVSSVERLADAFLATGFPYNRRTAADNNAQRVDHFLRRSHGLRRAGAATLDLAYVACGRLDGFWELGLQPWDIAGGALLVQEAGGLLSDLDGSESYMRTGNIVAANPKVFKEMLQVLHRQRIEAATGKGKQA